MVIANAGFAALARITAKANALDDLRIAEYPGSLGIDSPEQLHRRIGDTLIDALVDRLTHHADLEADKAQPIPRGNSPVFRGSYKQVNRHFLEQNWTDGLPIVPPTLSRIEQFLQFVNHDPNEEIAVLPPAHRCATPHIIAVNAIMAGCEPYHMPIIVAAVRAFANPRFNIGNMGSTSALLPYALLNGPVVKQLGFETGAQLLSRGPNPVLGRAIGMIFRNVASFVSGQNYMGTFGYPLVLAFAEDETGNPWESFHVEQGFTRDSSTITLGITNNWGPAPSPTSTSDKGGAEVTLEVICREILKKKRAYTFPGKGPNAEKAMITIVITAMLAQSLHAAGYSKQAVKEYIHEHTRITLREFEWITRYTTAKERSSRQEKAAAGVFPPEYAGNPDDLVRLLSGPEILHIMVCGDPNRNRLMTLEGGHADPTTVQIDLPSEWLALVERAKIEYE